MNPNTNRPSELWAYKDHPISVGKYFDAHRGEFRLSRMKSGYPYGGDPWADFTEFTEINPYEGYHRFEGQGDGFWGLVKDKIRNGQTADILASAERLGGVVNVKGSSGSYGSFGPDSRNVWVQLLDGGVGVEVNIGEDEYTNKPEGWQRTTIRGPRAFRAVLELLGYDWIDRKLKGEIVKPEHAEISKLVNDLLKGEVS